MISMFRTVRKHGERFYWLGLNNGRYYSPFGEPFRLMDPEQAVAHGIRHGYTREQIELFMEQAG